MGLPPLLAVAVQATSTLLASSVAVSPVGAPGSAGTVLLDNIDALLFAYQMSATTRARMLQMVGAMPGNSASQRKDRVKAALIITAMSPDFVIQK